METDLKNKKKYRFKALWYKGMKSFIEKKIIILWSYFKLHHAKISLSFASGR